MSSFLISNGCHLRPVSVRSIHTTPLRKAVRSGPTRRGRLRAESTVKESLEVSLDPTIAPVLTAEQILEILPHRYPFLLVDRVTVMEEGKTIVGYKNITMNDNFFCGHFPGRPIMPGVLQVEALAQLGGILVLSGMDDTAKQNFFFGGVETCRFRKPVVPGDTLMMKVDLIKVNKRFGVVKAHGEAYVNEEIVCQADLTLVVAKT